MRLAKIPTLAFGLLVLVLLGDNRADSEDARCFGTIPRGQIVGRVLARYWPFGRIGAP